MNHQPKGDSMFQIKLTKEQLNNLRFFLINGKWEMGIKQAAVLDEVIAVVGKAEEIKEIPKTEGQLNERTINTDRRKEE